MIPSILTWNCRGAASTSFWVSLKDLVTCYKSNILVLVETCIHSDRAQQIMNSLHFVNFFAVEAMGFSSGIWLFWDNYVPSMEILAWNEQCITTAISGGMYVDWVFSAIYAPRTDWCARNSGPTLLNWAKY